MSGQKGKKKITNYLFTYIYIIFILSLLKNTNTNKIHEKHLGLSVYGFEYTGKYPMSMIEWMRCSWASTDSYIFLKDVFSISVDR